METEEIVFVRVHWSTAAAVVAPPEGHWLHSSTATRSPVARSDQAASQEPQEPPTDTAGQFVSRKDLRDSETRILDQIREMFAQQGNSETPAAEAATTVGPSAHEEAVADSLHVPVWDKVLGAQERKNVQHHGRHVQRTGRAC